MASRFPGSQCRYRLVPEIDNGTLCRHDSPVPGPSGRFSLWPELHEPDFLPAAVGLDAAISDADKAEFEIIKKMPVYSARGRPHGRFRSVNSYVSERTLHFGSPSAYAAFAIESDNELAITQWGKKHVTTLRSLIEFNHKNQEKMQQIFYRWVRKSYQRKYGDDVDVPKLIGKGMSEVLAAKIAEVRGSVRVKKIHDENFHAGGFNPRPVKLSDHYILGTLSDHGTGMAVDIDDTKNAQFTAEEWKFIEDLVKKPIKRVGRWDTETSAEGLWKDIVEINDLFVKKVASEITRIEKERAEKAEKEKAEAARIEKETPGKEKTSLKPASPKRAGAKRPVTPLKEVLGKHSDRLSRWVISGFFHLPLDLVLEFHVHGFTWGATFPNIDLHHFQLDKE